jgi:organic radical activating enzyme
MTYQVNEIFTSVQGEGYWTGVPATFIRLQGCPVGCWWCDSGPLADEVWGRQTNGLTRNTWNKGGKKMTIDQIMREVNQRHVVITGGEPTLYELDALLIALQGRHCFTQLETSGLNSMKGELWPNWVTWSPKENLGYDAPKSLLSHADEIKFVVDVNLHFGIVESRVAQVRQLGGSPWVYLMPEGCPPTRENVTKTLAWLHSNNVDQFYRFGDRLQYRLGVR